MILFVIIGTFVIGHMLILYSIGFEFIKEYWKTFFSKKLFMALFMPTLIYARYEKERLKDKTKVTKFIKEINIRNFRTSLFILIILGILDLCKVLYYIKDIEPLILAFKITGFIMLWGTISRGLEIFYAFYKDSIEQLSKKKHQSNLKYYERIKLAMTSYIELIFNYAIFYFVYINLITLYKMDLTTVLINFKINNVIDALYYSVVTITTLGYGDIHPNSNFYDIPIQLASSAEVINGFILIIVSFTIYVSKSLEAQEYNANENENITDSKTYVITVSEDLKSQQNTAT